MTEISGYAEGYQAAMHDMYAAWMTGGETGVMQWLWDNYTQASAEERQEMRANRVRYGLY